MAARNDITGDKIQTKGSNDIYRSGWDAIFSKTKKFYGGDLDGTDLGIVIEYKNLTQLRQHPYFERFDPFATLMEANNVMVMVDAFKVGENVVVGAYK